MRNSEGRRAKGVQGNSGHDRLNRRMAPWIKIAAQIVVAFAPLIIAGVLPFIRVVKGGSPLRWFFLCWLFLVVTMALLSLGAPIAVGMFSKEAAREVSRWVPEGPHVFLMVLGGWFYAGIIVGVAYIVGDYWGRGTRRRKGKWDEGSSQPHPNVSDEDLKRILRRDYPVESHEEISRLINELQLADKPRVVLACLKVGGKDPKRLQKELRDAPGYWREIISVAEYPLASKRWTRLQNEPAEARQKIYDADWKRYCDWLNKP